MEEIAIYFQKIDLGNDVFVFKPISVIKGEHDKLTNEFTTNYGAVCSKINGGGLDILANEFYCFNTTIEKLREQYGENLSEDTLLTEYFDNLVENVFLGYYDGANSEVKVIFIHNSKIEDFVNQLNQISSTSETTESIEEKYKLVINVLEELKTLDNLEEAKLMADKLIGHYKSELGILEVEEDDVKDSDKGIIEENEEDIDDERVVVEVNKDKFKDKNVMINKITNQIISLKELRQEVSSSIIGQDRAVKDITREIFINQTSKDPQNKSHLLVTGPTGTGKTEIIRIISKILNIPSFEADATAYTKTGYEGKSVYGMINALIANAGGDIKRAENGILVIDEIDKKILGSKRDDVSGTAVIESLYKIMDRGVIELSKDKFGYSENSIFDTSNLTIILLGAFEYIYEKLLNSKSIGFVDDSQGLIVPKKEIFLSKKILKNNGVPAEFLGRIGNITWTNYFEENDVVKLLKRSNISPLLIQQEYFKDVFNVDLRYTDGYIREIARKALEAETNARELKPLVKESLKEAIDDFLDGRKGKVLKLTKRTVSDPRNYYVE